MVTDTAALMHARRPVSGWRACLTIRLKALAAYLWHCRQLQRERQQLLALTDRELRDVGITRVDAVQEARKPLWR